MTRNSGSSSNASIQWKSISTGIPPSGGMVFQNFARNPGLVNKRSCTCRLRIIPSARESGKILLFHHRVRGLCHDSTPFFLSARAAGIALVIFHAACCLASPRPCDPAETSGAHPATAPALQRPEAVSWPYPHAPLCRLCAGPRARTPAARVPAPPHRVHAGTAAPGGHVVALLSPSALCLSGLGGAGQYQCQRSSQRRPLAPAALHQLRWLFPRDPRHAVAW